MLATIAFGLIGVAAVVQIVWLFAFRNRGLRGGRFGADNDPVSHWLLLAVSLLCYATTIRRSIAIDFVAVTNTYESLVFLAATLALLTWVYRIQRWIACSPLIGFGATVMTGVFLAISSSPIAADTIAPPIPALQSSWLVLHVALSFFGEACFTIGFVAAIRYLTLTDPGHRRAVDRVIYTAIGLGYPIFTAGALIFGAIWAKSAWGRYWSWDPKETWALITWLTYTIYLHTRLIRRISGKASAIISIIGYLFMIFTFFGVNYLLAGLHSYG